MPVNKILVRMLLIVVLTVVNLCSVSLAQQVSPVAPRKAVVEAVVKEAYEKVKNDNNGKNPDYIPHLAQVDPKLFGIAIVTTDNWMKPGTASRLRR